MSETPLPAVMPPARLKTRRDRLREELLNGPNLITISRMLLIPVYLGFLAFENRHNSFWAAIVFSAAAASDWIDGWLARISNKITTLGKFLDPLADKLIVLSGLIMLIRLGRVPTWVVVLILARELLISGLRTLAASEGLVIAASQGGKWKTSLQLTGIIALIVHYHYPIDWFFGRLQTDFHAAGLTLLYLSLVPSIASAIEYVRGYYTLDGAQREKVENMNEPA
jgi:CDP-diacylglycerol--glycerol-3-phosphate 3-phosphatidyltransferase